ncbi:MAG: alkyl hydroperoxide reductase, partial [Planctomycetota bacterium]
LQYPGKVHWNSKKKLLIISNTGGHQIWVCTPKGKIEHIIGSGKAGFRDGSFSKAQFTYPQGVFSEGDEIFVADRGNHSIRRILLIEKRVETIAGKGKQAQRFHQGGKASMVALNSPWDLVKVGKYLYICMAGFHQIWRMDLEKKEIHPFLGSGVENLKDGPPKKACLAQPSAITYFDGFLYFLDSETSALRRFPLKEKGRVETLVGKGLFIFGDQDGPKTQASLQHPLAIAASKDAIWIGDTYNSKIKLFDLKTKTLKTIAGTGKKGKKDGPFLEATFNEMGGLVFGDNKHLYVADTNNCAIRVLLLEKKKVKTLSFQK